MGLFGIDIPTDGDVLVLGQAANGTITQLEGSVLQALREAGNAVWRQDLRPKMLPDLLTAELGKGDRFADGFTLYDFDVRLADDDVVQTIQRNDAGDLVVHCVTGRNTVIATSTQPSFLGSYADPRFSLDFALTFDFVVDIPPVTAPVGGSRVLDLRFIAPHLDSQNLAGDVLLMLGRIVTFLAGTDVDSLLAAEIRANLGVGQINAALAPLSAVLQRYLDAGYRYLSLYAGDPDALRGQLGSQSGLDSLPAGTQSLVLLCRQPDESGAIEGEISWLETAGQPVDDATFEAATRLATRFVPQEALGGLLEAVQAGGRSPQPDQAVGEELRIARVVESFARQPTAATAAQEALTDAGIHLWDASTQQAPPEPAGRAPAIAPRLRTSLSPLAYQAILEAFKRGPVQFDIRCTVRDAGGTHPTGRTVAMWFDDSDGWQRRRYRVEGVETGQPMTITCELATGWHWFPGRVDQIAPRNWSGTVTVRKAVPLADMIRDGDLQMTVTVKDGSRRTVSVATLEAVGAVSRPGGQRSIIVVGGTPADEASLNPQPLPPKWQDQLLHRQGDGHAVLLAADATSLNPQPLPPKWRELAAARLEVGGRAEKAALNPQPLPPKVAHRLRGPSTFLKRFGTHTEQRLDLPVHDPAPIAQAVEAHVDTFGDLVTQIDPDVLIPDTVDPGGYGTVRGIDFRVWPKG